MRSRAIKLLNKRLLQLNEKAVLSLFTKVP